MGQFQWPAQYSPPEVLHKLHFSMLGERDLDEIIAIERSSFSQPWTRELFTLEFASPTSLGIGARWGGENGFLTGYLFLWLVVDEAQVHSIATHPTLRGKEIACCLLGVGFELARQKGARWASLEVREGNLAARRLYQKFGFNTVGRRPGYYNSPREDALLMNAEL